MVSPKNINNFLIGVRNMLQVDEKYFCFTFRVRMFINRGRVTV